MAYATEKGAPARFSGVVTPQGAQFDCAPVFMVYVHVGRTGPFPHPSSLYARQPLSCFTQPLVDRLAESAGIDRLGNRAVHPGFSCMTPPFANAFAVSASVLYHLTFQNRLNDIAFKEQALFAVTMETFPKTG